MCRRNMTRGAPQAVQKMPTRQSRASLTADGIYKRSLGSADSGYKHGPRKKDRCIGSASWSFRRQREVDELADRESAAKDRRCGIVGAQHQRSLTQQERKFLGAVAFLRLQAASGWLRQPAEAGQIRFMGVVCLPWIISPSWRRTINGRHGDTSVPDRML